jgi:fatty acid CoA ligase FadD9
VASIIHSSGSTGTPKGALIPDRMSTPVWVGGYMKQLPVVGMVFAPMNHFMGRYVVFGALAQGGTAYFTLKPDLSTLFDDIRLARPTFISFFPRIFDLIYQHYQSELMRRTSVGGDAEAVGRQVRAEMRDTFLGDRLRGATIGSAPTTPEVRQFIRECFDIMLLEGYGSTEGGIQITAQNRVLRPPVIDYKLRDVPELGYYTTDKPYPRGELCVKSSMQVPGYFKRSRGHGRAVRCGRICPDRRHHGRARRRSHRVHRSAQRRAEALAGRIRRRGAARRDVRGGKRRHRADLRLRELREVVPAGRRRSLTWRSSRH